MTADQSWGFFTESWNADDADPQDGPPPSPADPLSCYYRVQFHSRRSQICVSPNPEKFSPAEYVITDSPQGCDLGQIAEVVSSADHKADVLRILRRALPVEVQSLAAKRTREAQAVGICQAIVRQQNCAMEVTDAEFTLDGSQITFYYTAGRYVDFRGLVKLLYRTFGTRIWMIWYDGEGAVKDVFSQNHRRRGARA
jgi:cell fate regulator YaaT (PSP1 superfamily)